LAGFGDITQLLCQIQQSNLVFPVGGIREKVIAARRAGIRELILPEDNRSDFKNVPEHIRKGIKVHFASDFGEVAPQLFRVKS
jgi:ATP-dependent Lon protease